jgi:uncharacterized membrane protein YebE (DUF533 family)
MDAIKMLGSLLNENALGSKAGGDILGSLLGGSNGSKGGAGNAGDILGTLLGGKKGSSKGGWAALAAIAAAALASQKGKGATKGSSGSDLLGSLVSQLGGSSAQGGGLGDLVGGLLGGGSKGQSSSGGGLGDLVGGLLGGGQGGGSGSPLGGMLGSLLGAGAAGGALGLAAGETPPPVDADEAEDGARILIEAMCLAAKSDGRVDETEREAIVGKLGDLDKDEADFLRKKLSGKADVDEFVSRVPAEMSSQVYAFSLMAVKLDSRGEAEYFARLAQGLGLGSEEANEIHRGLGQPEIFA